MCVVGVISWLHKQWNWYKSLKSMRWSVFSVCYATNSPEKHNSHLWLCSFVYETMQSDRKVNEETMQSEVMNAFSFISSKSVRYYRFLSHFMNVISDKIRWYRSFADKNERKPAQNRIMRCPLNILNYGLSPCHLT